MKVVYDHQIYVTANYGGIARYFFEVSKSLVANHGVEVVNTVRLSNNIFTGDPIFNAKKFFPGQSFKGKKRILRMVNEVVSKRKLKEKFDVFHPTYNQTYFLNTIKNKPFVITIHDLIQEKFKHQYPEFGEDTALFKNRKLLIAKCSKIIAVSENTRNDLVEFYNIPTSKIEVVYHGNSINEQNFYTGVLPFNNYILFVGRRKFYKNFQPFIEAIAPLILKEGDLSVVCAGGGEFNKNEHNLFRDLKIAGRLTQVEITDELLSELYRKALFFVFPSLYEGFGIPILEAFGCSCPVVLSNTSSLPEIGGDAALYFDPYDKDDMMDKVKSLLYDEKLRDNLKEKGSARVKEFSWAQTAKGHFDVYRSLSK